MTTTAIRTAIPAERSTVVHVHTGTGPRAGCYTGIIISANAAVTCVLPYSAGCLHAPAFVIPTASITKVEPR